VKRERRVRIPLENDPEFAIVDAEDSQRVSKYKWFAVMIDGKKHAGTLIDGKLLLMEQLVMFGEFWKEKSSPRKAEVRITLANGKGFITVDAEDYQRGSKYKWIPMWVNGEKHIGTIVEDGSGVLLKELLEYGEFWKKENEN